MSSLEYEPERVRFVEVNESKGDGVSQIVVDKPREIKGDGKTQSVTISREEDEYRKGMSAVRQSNTERTNVNAYYEVGPATQAYNMNKEQAKGLVEREREEGMAELRRAGWIALVFCIILLILVVFLYLAGYLTPPSECGKRNHNGTCAPGTICAIGNDGDYECLRRCSAAFPCPSGFICESSDGKQVCLPL